MNFHNSRTSITARFIALPLILLLVTFTVPPLAAADGTVNIEEEVKIAPGEKGIVEISVNSLPSPGVAAIQVGPEGKLTYDSAVLQLQDISGVDLFSVNAQSIDNEAGEATFLATAPSGAVQEGVVVELEFKVPTGTQKGYGGIEITEFDVFADPTGDPLSPSIDNGSAGPGASSTNLASGWNLFSPQGIPQNPDPATALGDDIDSLSLYYDYSPAQGYTVYPKDTDTTQLTWKEGYWAHLDVETQVDMSVGTTTQGHTLEYTNPGWKMIGAPYNVDWSQVSFSDPNDFGNDGAGNVRLVSWDPTKSLYLNHYSDTSYTLDGWRGYWVYVENASSSEPATFTISKTINPPPPPGSQSPLPESINPEELDYPPLPQELEGNFQVLAYPNPVTKKDQVTFAVQMPNVEKIKITVTNTSGEIIYNSEYQPGKRLTWGLRDLSGNKVANGILLYKIQAKRTDDTTQASEVRRLLVLR